MPKPTAKKKKAKKNPTDINLLARSIVEAAIGEALTPKKPVSTSKRQSKRLKSHAKRSH